MSENLTIFFEIIREGNLEEVRKLIARGYDVNAVFEDGITPLICASHHGRFELVKMLVEMGADINVLDVDCNSALFYLDKICPPKTLNLVN